MSQIDYARVPEYYHRYIKQVAAQELGEALKSSSAAFIKQLSGLPPEIWAYRYAEDKWTVKQVVQHVIDAERVFCYRALRFARADKTELPGFDENSYADAAPAAGRSGEDLIEELSSVQKASLLLFASFSEEELERSGMANGKSIYVRGIGYVMAGHTKHHQSILIERYLNKKPPAE